MKQRTLIVVQSVATLRFASKRMLPCSASSRQRGGAWVSRVLHHPPECPAILLLQHPWKKIQTTSSVSCHTKWRRDSARRFLVVARARESSRRFRVSIIRIPCGCTPLRAGILDVIVCGEVFGAASSVAAREGSTSTL